jgi:hypothetical protein
VTGYDSAGDAIKTYYNFTEAVSPWPAFAQVLYGNSNYDWLLAAANVRASINRLDDTATTRKYSYLIAESTFLFQQADAGSLVMPSDMNDIITNISTAITKYGVSQVIQNLLDETCISYYYEGRDPQSDPHFTTSATSQNSNLFNIIASTIDSDTATLDLKSLISNMSQLTRMSLSSATSTSKNTSTSNASPSEISVSATGSSTNAQKAESQQFINELGDLRDATIDLQTFDGISKLMRTIRIISDYGPNRSRTSTSTTTVTEYAKPKTTTTSTAHTGSIKTAPSYQGGNTGGEGGGGGGD